jgi:hypothetical protein
MGETVQKKLKGLRTFNLVMALLHFIQAIAVLLLRDSDKGVVPITVNYLQFDPERSTLLPTSDQIAEVNIAWFVAIFFCMSAFAHFFISTIYRKKYESDLKRGINKIRWFEYALSASVMMLAISFLTGIYDLASLVMIFALDAIMNLLGLAMEVYNSARDNTNWLTYILGCIAGIVPWIVFGIYVVSITEVGKGNIPDFVYWIYVSIFLFFNSFAVNMYLQYKKIGPWKDYLFGEKVYIILSLVAKSLLAWQVFGGTLRP